jgi:hypothetical protein
MTRPSPQSGPGRTHFAATFGSIYMPGSLTAFAVDPWNEYRAYFMSRAG